MGETQENAADPAAAAQERAPLRTRSYYRLNAIFYGGALLLSLLLPLPGNQGFQLFGWRMPAMCPSQAVLGVNCPGCGLTRSFVCLSHGEWQGAQRYNRVGFLVYGFVAWLFLYNLVQAMGAGLRLPLRWGDRAGMTVVALLVGNWLFNLCLGGWTWLRTPL